MDSELLKTEIIEKIKNLMKNERIQPEPEFECFFKYLAIAQSDTEFINNEKIFELVKSHGIHLLNDVKYWLDISLEENFNKDCLQSVPVLDPKHFIINDYNDFIEKLKELPSEWTVIQITKKFTKFDIASKNNSKIVPGMHITKFYCGKNAERREYFSMGRTSRKLYDAYNNTNSELSSHYMDLIFQVVLSASFLKCKDIYAILRLALYPNENESVNTSQLMLLVENIKVLNLRKENAIKKALYKPVILILDNEFENIPWEMLTPLVFQPVCRISSFHLLYALYKYHQPHIKNGYRLAEMDSVYSLINPGKDLESCEKQMKEFLKKRLPWADKEIGIVPDPKELVTKIKNYSLYLYCGHGSGTQYLKTKDLKKTYVKGLVLLFGCSSNMPRNGGGKTPHQNSTYTYLTNGCPLTIGCIQDVGSTDADAACEYMLSEFMPSVTITESSQAVVTDPKEPNVLLALSKAKSKCTKYWSKSSFVARGIPCKTIIGNKSKIFSETELFTN
ncbi:conserved hypothetical protein [Pediculus humanus corporis]|uniref:separase n=1 Tax=Pediculus humanus subsp. corporis TaxID=121224 RepID=E0VC81_PEDHC|nr:uncharacterized protein Phum_PHUM080610 [Pediculus humanus corporis]EEB10987.1 conserved hypothetical protein [Pediculus humanus corporis]